MDFIKQLAGALTAPLTVALVLAVLAMVLRLRQWRRAASWFAVAAFAVAYLFSLSPVADLLIGPLERRHPPLAEAPAPRFIVVLGSGFSPRGSVPVTAALDADGLARIVEGVRLARLWPESTLVVSGGAPQGRRAAARGYELLARELGIEDPRLIVVSDPLDTTAEGVAIAGIVKSDAFVLVTSAFHMPRAMMEMQRRGLNPLAAPTAHRYDDSRAYGLKSLIPNATALQRSEFALHEYLGLLAIRLGVGA